MHFYVAIWRYDSYKKVFKELSFIMYVTLEHYVIFVDELKNSLTLHSF